MLELELILLRFLEGEYPGLTPAEQQAFEALLEWQDDMLLEAISGSGLLPEPRFAGLIDRLRAC
jgi:succinate dehydrogenase flavin-adding protein (antitoxin of CptAB toxin-antitoxin module)